MKHVFRASLAGAFILTSGWSAASASNDATGSLPDAASQLVTGLLSEVTALRGKSVAIVITVPEGATTECSDRYADALEKALMPLAKVRDLKIVERRNLRTLEKEWAMDAYIRESTAKLPGNLRAADVQLRGKLTVLEKHLIELSADLVDTESGEKMALVTTQLKADKRLREACETWFTISPLPKVPSANVPSLSTEAVMSIPIPLPLSVKEAGINFGNVDVDALEKYNAAVNFDQGTGTAEDKAAKWRALGAQTPAYADIARKRALEWTRSAELTAVTKAEEFDNSSAAPREKAANWRDIAGKVPSYKEAALKRAQVWERYATELIESEKVRSKRAKIRDADYAKLKRLLGLSVVNAADKQNWVEMFVKAYGVNCDDNPYIGDVVPFLSSSTRSGLPSYNCGRPTPRLSTDWAKTEQHEMSAGEAAPRFNQGTMNLDLNYPGAGVRYFLSGKTALEVRAQDDKGNLAAGARLYRYPTLFTVDSKFKPYLCAEADYISFKGTSSKGNGWAGGAFAGVEYALSRSFSLQFDTGGLYLALKDRNTSLTENDFEFTLNFGVNFYIKSDYSRVSSPEDHRDGSRIGSESDHVRERAQSAQEELDRQRENP